MRGLVLISIAALTGCSKGSTVSQFYDLPIAEVNERVPKQVRVCWGLQAAHMKGFAEAGLERDIADTCERSARQNDISKGCRAYGEVAALYGKTAEKGANLSALADRSDEAFASCVDNP